MISKLGVRVIVEKEKEGKDLGQSNDAQILLPIDTVEKCCGKSISGTLSHVG